MSTFELMVRMGLGPEDLFHHWKSIPVDRPPVPASVYVLIAREYFSRYRTLLNHNIHTDIYYGTEKVIIDPELESWF